MELGGGLLNILLKYFLHGISFSFLLLVLAFVWTIIAVALVFIGFIIGLIIGFLVLFYIIGGINAVLTDLIWGVSIKTDRKSLLAHGFVLFILLIIAAIPQFVISFVVPSLATTIVMFIIYCFIDGFIAKSVAGLWEISILEDIST